jgi:hypothetical protein
MRHLIFISMTVLFSAVPTLTLGQSQGSAQMSREDYFITQAAAIASPSYSDPAEVNRDLRKQGRCAALAIKNLLKREASDRSLVLTAAYEGDCRHGVGGLVLALWQQSSETTWEFKNMWATTGSYGSYEQLAGPVGPRPEQIAEFQAAFQRDQLDPFPASKLPAWPVGKVMPNLPLGVEWQAGMERELYEAVRAGDYRIFCAYHFTMTCFADIPGRNTQRTPILVTNGFWNMYDTKSAAAALDVVLGNKPSLTLTELAAKNKAQEDRMAKAARDAVMLAPD